MDLCVDGKEHDVELKIASFGQQSWQCLICKQWFDEMEDSQP